MKRTTDNARRTILAVDVGNSRIKFGLFDRVAPNPDAPALPACRHALATAIDAEIPWDELRAWVADESPPAGVIAGANPRGVRKVLDGWPDDWRIARVLDDPREIPLPVDLPEPGKVGIDRLLAALAANVLRPPEAPAVVVDTGTATTVDLVSAAGTFRGGAILPGFELSARSLHRYTALLPLVGIDELATEPHPPLGRNTREALRSGLFWGQLGAVRELIARLSEESRPREMDRGGTPDSASSAAIFLTGGGASLLAVHLPEARWEPHLALQGLVLASERVESDQ